MYEHPSFTYRTYAVEQQRIDRENEMRRLIAEHPERIVYRRRSILARVRDWFRTGRADAVAAAIASDSPRVICESAGRPVHAR